ncbi:MAG: NAD(P)-dependent oxidoreductase [Thermoleophilia bacterium]|nr:NAD(P)-dependent oxidoreductase [Thermoleophilia bacterium]
MHVFVAGATGAIGRPLVAALVRGGHRVTGMTRTPAKAPLLRELGAEPVVCDAFDAAALERAVATAAPDAIVHELTALPAAIDPRRFAEQLEENDRLRIEGTRNLVAAALAAGVRRVVAESISFAYAPGGGGLRVEDDPLGLAAPKPWGRTIRAVDELERTVLSAPGVDGTILRYGTLYGPRTFYGRDGSTAEIVRRRRLPLVGAGTGVTSFLHVEDAASATVLALERAAQGTYNVVDDDPAPAAEWLPAYARALGAPPPRRLPPFLVRLLAGPTGLAMLAGGEGASNAKARRELGFEPRFASWRQGFEAAL